MNTVDCAGPRSRRCLGGAQQIQQSRDLLLRWSTGQVQRSVALAIAQSRVGAGLQQGAHRLGVAARGGAHQRSAALRVALVYIGAQRPLRLQSVHVALIRSAEPSR